MKTCLSLWLTILLAGLVPVSGHAQVAPQQHSLVVKVEPLSRGSTVNVSQGTHVAPDVHTPGVVASIKDKQTQRSEENESIQITVRNFGPLPDTAQVEWYFLSQPEKVDHGKSLDLQRTIVDQGARSVELTPGGTNTFAVTSKDVTSTVTRHTKQYVGGRGKVHQDRLATGKKTSGSALSGWMVRLVADGRVIDARGSTDTLEDAAKDDAKFNVLKEQ